ncbi:MAG: prolyl aminopeptidase [Planktomarina sp.]
MDKDAGQNRTGQHLYPPIEPFDQRMLDVGDDHTIYVEQCGNPRGVPVIVLHGGPGGGCSPAMRRYFDPNYYRVILFDQRGCGRSRPHASIDANTTWHLVDDIEFIRETLSIDRWMVFGGSWGATLALIYAQAHPNQIMHLILRGVFLGTQRELDWFYAGGAGQFWPDAWQRFTDLIPADEQDDLISAYHKRLFCDDLAVQTRYARAWSMWENALASIQSSGMSDSTPAQYARAFSRLENHYFINKVFLTEGKEILSNINILSEIHGTIVQGRFDMICPPIMAWKLSQAWPNSTLKMIGMAGHSLSDAAISAALCKVMNELRAP